MVWIILIAVDRYYYQQRLQDALDAAQEGFEESYASYR